MSGTPEKILKRKNLKTGFRAALLLAALALITNFISSSHAGQNRMEDAFSPRGGATQLIVRTIDNAKTSIQVAAYAFTSKPIAKALVAARNKGVDVQIVLNKDPANARIAKYFKDNNVPLRISGQYRIMHDKFMVIDAKTVELGSFNYTYSAEYDNAENVLVLHDAGRIAADYSRAWKNIWNGASK